MNNVIEKLIHPINKKDILGFTHSSMATVFGIYFLHPDSDYAEKAAQAGFAEIDRLEQELSRYIPNSEVSRINALKQYEKTVVSVDTLNCLRVCNELYQKTKGVFDISSGSVIKLWKEKTPGSKKPKAVVIKNAVAQTGLPWLHVHESTFEVELMYKQIDLDPGGFGKGYALDKVTEILTEWEIDSFLIHSGFSTVLCGGLSNDQLAWPVSFTNPATGSVLIQTYGQSGKAFSGSGLEKGKHIIDPRTGYPVDHHLSAWAMAPSAAESDALSTAFMIMTTEEIEQYCSENKDISGIVILNNKNKDIKYFGTDF